MPTGWRPKDVLVKHPIKIVEDIYGFKRYETTASIALKIYVIFQMLMSVVLLLFMFYNYSNIGFDGLLLFGAFIFFGIYSYSLLMDRDKISAYSEGFRGILGIVYILIVGDWFGLNTYFEYGTLFLLAYFGLTFFSGVYFTYFEGKELVKQQIIN